MIKLRFMGLGRGASVGVVALASSFFAACVVEVDEAGERFDQTEEAIFGGAAVAATNWPSSVAFKHELFPFPLCGGVLVHPKWVLTAKHCVILDGKVEPALAFTATIGRSDLSGAGGVTRKGTRIVTHPNWVVNTPAFDLALVELDQKVAARTTEWATPGEVATFRAGDTTTAAGWGLLSSVWTGTNPPLQQADLPFQGIGSACDKYHGAGSVASSAACIGPTNGARDTCPGDSGGAAYARVGGIWKELGVVSKGGLNLFQACGVANLPGLYSLPSAGADFLHQNLPSAEGRLQTRISDGRGAFSTRTTKSSVNSRLDLVAGGQFNSTATGDILTYDSSTGNIQLYTSDASANLAVKAAQTGFSKTLTQMQSGKITGDNFDDIVVYDPVAGSLRVYANDGKGTFKALGNPKAGVGGAVKNIVMGNFDGDSATDVLLYTASTGTAAVYEISAAGAISLVSTSSSLDKTYELALGGNLSPDATTDVLFYSPSTGISRMYKTASGKLGTMFKEQSWNRDWQYIVPGDFGGNDYTDLYFYNPRTGVTKTFTSDGTGKIVQFGADGSLPKTWLRIATGQLFGTKHTDLFLYDRWMRP